MARGDGYCMDAAMTPWGWAAASWTERGLRGIVLPCRERSEAERLLACAFGGSTRKSPWPEWRAQMKAYFSGEDLPLLLPLDVTAPGDFTAAVWSVVRSVPYGARETYGEIARRAGRPGAARAVGAAMRCNPVPLYIPCHRVVASRGDGGFSAAGGPEMKARLLDLERGTGE